MPSLERSPLAKAFSSPDRKRLHNRQIFTTIAPRYDLITRLLSYGQDQRWKKRLLQLAPVCAGELALDVACGTGDLALRLAAQGAVVVGLDLTPAMLGLAQDRSQASTIHYVAGDIGNLPFGNRRFDVVTAGYALRNLPDLDQGLSEVARVLKPGGRLLALDFNRPASTAVRTLYLAYLWAVGSLLGAVLHRDPETYAYIAASLRRYPGAAAVADRMHAAGFARAEWRPALGGLMAFHVAEKAAAG